MMSSSRLFPIIKSDMGIERNDKDVPRTYHTPESYLYNGEFLYPK